MGRFAKCGDRKKSLENLAWKLARALPKRNHPKEEYNARAECPHCALSYCRGFDGVQIFCRECYYENACIKTTEFPALMCDWCKGENNDGYQRSDD